MTSLQVMNLVRKDQVAALREMNTARRSAENQKEIHAIIGTLADLFSIEQKET